MREIKNINSADVMNIMGIGLMIYGTLQFIFKFTPIVTLVVGVILMVVGALMMKAQKKYGLMDMSENIIYGRKRK